PDLDRARDEPAQQRECEEAGGGRVPVRRLGPGALEVDVDPLPVLGGLGEAVDPVLRHLHVVAHRDFLSDEPLQLAEALDDALRHGLSFISVTGYETPNFPTRT